MPISKQKNTNKWFILSAVLISMLLNTSCTHSVTGYRILREPVNDTVPIKKKSLVINSYSTVPSIFLPSPYLISIAFIPFELLNTEKVLSTADLKSDTDYNKNFIEMFINHPNYDDRFIIYDDNILKALLEVDKIDLSAKVVELIGNKIGIKYLITGNIKSGNNFELELKVYNTFNSTVLNQSILSNTNNSSAIADAIDLIYNSLIPNYSFEDVIIGYKYKTVGYNNLWVSYQNEEKSLYKSFLFWTISTAVFTTAATIYDFDIIDLYDEVINR